ncbi:ferrous iron transport protein A [Terricaulis sp.]|uniref:ferrous iron transport protein A n=1 Tax=Terricaulis sp. TaxID=2768686 RepID=UPI0037847E63
MTVADLLAGQHARVLAVQANPALEAKLREIGFCEGDGVQLIARGPLGGQPLAVRLNRRIIAMRDDEAAALVVEAIHG